MSEMMTLDEAIEMMKQWDGAMDGRDMVRFLNFVPLSRAGELVDLKDTATEESWGEVLPWTEENVLNNLKSDSQFGMEKAIGERGASVSCMFHVVNMWCLMLRNGLEETSYSDYAKSFFRKVLDHYGWTV